MRGNKTGTLCWDCSKGADECCFMKRLAPVPNWTAKKVLCEGSWTYRVISCPNFEPNIDARASKKRIKVKCVETGRVYTSAKECAAHLNISACYLSNCLCGRVKQIRGLHFEWVE